jgi:hypothetical protein
MTLPGLAANRSDMWSQVGLKGLQLQYVPDHALMSAGGGGGRTAHQIYCLIFLLPS